MGWKLIEKPKTVRVTKSLAKEFAEMDSIPNDRPLSERRLMVYRKIMADDGFRPVAWATCECAETGTTYRINGKHTSTLLSSMNPIPEFWVTIERYAAETLEDVVKLYATFDSQSQLRSSRDIYASFAGSISELREIPVNIINTCASGIPYARLQEKAWTLTAAERAETLLDHVDFIQWVDEILRPMESRNACKMLKRSPLIAAMLLTWERDSKKATLFWEAVRDETGGSPDDPDRKLGKWLNITDVNHGPGARRHLGRKADAREFFVKSLHAWNAWRTDNQRATLRYHADAELPQVV